MARCFSLFILFALCVIRAFAESTANDTNKSNKPMKVAASFNLWRCLMPSVFGVSGRTNHFLLHPTVCNPRW